MLKKVLMGIVLTILLFVSFFPRSIEVLNGNPVFETDQGRDYMAAKSIVVDHKFTLIGAELGAGQAGLQFLFHGPGYFYLIALALVLFNGNPVGGVFFMLLFGLSAIAFSIYFTSKMFDKYAGILMGFLVALCPFFIGQSRLMENHFPSVVFIMLIFYLVYLFTKDKKTIYIFWATFISAAIYNFEFALSIPLTITLLMFVVIILRTKIIRKIPVILGALILGYLPMILFEGKHGFMGIKSVFTYLFSHHPTSSVSPGFGKHALDIFNLYVYSFTDSFAGHLLIPVAFVLPLFIALVSFVYYKEKSKIFKTYFIYIFLLYPLNFAIFLLLRNIVFLHYIIDLYVANLLLTVYALWSLYKQKYYWLSGIIFAYVLLLFGFGTINAYNVSKSDYFDYGGVHKLKAKIEAVDFIYNDAKGKPFGLFSFDPPVYTYQYDYAVWWQGTTKYHYLPTQNKNGVFYLLIEPDPSKPWTYKGWEQTIIKSGKVIFTKVMPNSGLIVEKRIAE